MDRRKFFKTLGAAPIAASVVILGFERGKLINSALPMPDGMKFSLFIGSTDVTRDTKSLSVETVLRPFEGYAKGRTFPLPERHTDLVAQVYANPRLWAHIMDCAPVRMEMRWPDGRTQTAFEGHVKSWQQMLEHPLFELRAQGLFTVTITTQDEKLWG